MDTRCPDCEATLTDSEVCLECGYGFRTEPAVLEDDPPAAAEASDFTADRQARRGWSFTVIGSLVCLLAVVGVQLQRTQTLLAESALENEAIRVNILELRSELADAEDFRQKLDEQIASQSAWLADPPPLVNIPEYSIPNLEICRGINDVTCSRYAESKVSITGCPASCLVQFEDFRISVLEIGPSWMGSAIVEPDESGWTCSPDTGDRVELPVTIVAYVAHKASFDVGSNSRWRPHLWLTILVDSSENCTSGILTISGGIPQQINTDTTGIR